MSVQSFFYFETDEPCKVSGGSVMKIVLIGDCHARRMFSTALVTVLFLLSAGMGSAEIIYVEPGSSIQAAVNNSTSGDFVIVKAGEYEENVVVNVSGLTISSESGSPDSVLVRGREKNSSIFEVKADNVTISGFNITGLGKFSAFLKLQVPQILLARAIIQVM